MGKPVRITTGAIRVERESCCGLGIAEEESIPAMVPRGDAARIPLLFATCDYRLHLGI
jgi:hypothetical protein